MAIEVGQTVRDRFSQKVGVVIAREGTAMITVRPGGDPHLDFSVEEWRLDELPAAFSIAAFWCECLRFIKSDSGTSTRVRVAMVYPYVLGVVTSYLVLSSVCHCR